MSQERTGAPTDVTGGIAATDMPARAAGADASTATDTLAMIDAAALRIFAAVADHLIPEAHGMPSAGSVVGEARLRFVLTARPDLVEPLAAALRSELGEEPQARLDALARDEPASLAALQLAIVGGYYTDRTVRQQIGYPGQLAVEVRSWVLPPFIEEGLIDEVLARGPVWRDPRTGARAKVDGAPGSYAERYATTGRPEGGSDGRDAS